MNIKEIVLSALLVVFGLISGFIWERLKDAPSLASPKTVLVVLAYAVLLGLFLILVKHFYSKWFAVPLSVLFFAVSFHFDRFWAYGISLGILIVFLAVWSAQKEEEAAVKILLRRVIGRSLRLFFTALAIFLAFVYYGTIYQDPEPAKLLLPEAVFEATLRLTEPYRQNVIPGFRVEKEISKALYEFYINQIKNYAGKYITFSPILAAVSYFFALKAMSMLFYYAALALIFAALKILEKLSIIKKILIPTNKEIYV